MITVLGDNNPSSRSYWYSSVWDIKREEVGFLGNRVGLPWEALEGPEKAAGRTNAWLKGALGGSCAGQGTWLCTGRGGAKVREKAVGDTYQNNLQSSLLTSPFDFMGSQQLGKVAIGDHVTTTRVKVIF